MCDKATNARTNGPTMLPTESRSTQNFFIMSGFYERHHQSLFGSGNGQQNDAITKQLSIFMTKTACYKR